MNVQSAGEKNVLCVYSELFFKVKRFFKRFSWRCNLGDEKLHFSLCEVDKPLLFVRKTSRAILSLDE